MAELLLELFSEEIPARMQASACKEIAAALLGDLQQSGFSIPDDSWSVHATPQRLTLIVGGMPRTATVIHEPVRGPRCSAPDSAKVGFARKNGVDPADLREISDQAGETFWYLFKVDRTLTLRVELPKAVSGVLQRVSWPKSMRWGSGEVRWVRPLQSILCLLDGEVVPVRFGDVPCGRTTRGHRFMAPAPFDVVNAADYRAKLEAAKVVLEAGDRRRMILSKAAELASGAGLRVRDDPALVDEIAGLVEWPVPLIGRIDAAFMDIPSEVLVGTMRANQKYLALETADGKLADRFVVVANIEAPDGGAAIVAGNERVLRARFWDARHFWEQDKKTPLEDRLPALSRMVFHEKLGTVRERVDRLVSLAGHLVGFVAGAERAVAERAALLAKCDLVTGMVGEFPELQGIMGGHYARAQNEPAAIATALAEHYLPKGPDDRCPRDPTAVVVALADKLDTLAGFFAVQIKPTGSKDPFALRRAALGVIRLIRENGLRLPLSAVLRDAVAAFGKPVDPGAVAGEILAFVHDRLKVILRDEGVRHDLINAVLATGPDDDLVRLVARAAALRDFVDGEDGRNLLAGYRRAGNIVRIEAKKDQAAIDGPVDPGALAVPAERELYTALSEASTAVQRSLAAEDWTAAMQRLAALREPVDRFFQDVLVNAPETMLRVNRLRLLNGLRDALVPVADFALIEEGAGG